MKSDTPNALIHETSPYLLQHAYNPVQWRPWNEDTLDEARQSGKPLLISIGYAACHWCHVMERECFEDPEVAKLMNAHFVPVKVDREERPDVDQIYMDALQIMTGSGGWPLNVVALPDGRPFWGATYLPKASWQQALQQLHRLHREDPEKVRDYAENLTGAVQEINQVLPGDNPGLPSMADLDGWITSWKSRFDPEYGGHRGAPKFMMPVRLHLLMHWAACREDEAVDQHLATSLRAMAMGGLFDQLGGGFARYSVDARWHVPHFEKMLYDNAQLLGLYAQAYARYGDELYLQTVRMTLSFLQRELRAPKGGYYASLDADSPDPEGEMREGAFYTWSEADLREVLGSRFDRFKAAYNINSYGHWEDGQYVLIRTKSYDALADELGEDPDTLRTELQIDREALLKERELRPRPGLDDKLICSWNALLLSGLADTARYCQIPEAETAALELGEFLFGAFLRKDGVLLHSMAKGKPGPPGYLEDYAALIEGCLKLYSCCGDIRWIDRARQLTQTVYSDFSAEGQPFFHFTSKRDPDLIRKSVDVSDNVIPSSNSIMAKNLFLLGSFYDEPRWVRQSEAMLEQLKAAMDKYSGQYANWMQLALWIARPFYETVVSGPAAKAIGRELASAYLPHSFLAFSEEALELPLFASRFDPEQTRIFICRQGSCQRPLTEPSNAIGQLRDSLKAS